MPQLAIVGGEDGGCHAEPRSSRRTDLTSDFATAAGNGTSDLPGSIVPVVLQQLKYREKVWGAVFWTRKIEGWTFLGTPEIWTNSV